MPRHVTMALPLHRLSAPTWQTTCSRGTSQTRSGASLQSSKRSSVGTALGSPCRLARLAFLSLDQGWVTFYKVWRRFSRLLQDSNAKNCGYGKTAWRKIMRYATKTNCTASWGKGQGQERESLSGMELFLLARLFTSFVWFEFRVTRGWCLAFFFYPLLSFSPLNN